MPASGAGLRAERGGIGLVQKVMAMHRLASGRLRSVQAAFAGERWPRPSLSYSGPQENWKQSC